MKTSLTMPNILFTVILGSTLVLSGCQATQSFFGKRDNGSLEYQDSKKLALLQLPTEQDTAPFVPLYQTPVVGENTLSLTNEAGKQYQLPKPERAVAIITAPTE